MRRLALAFLLACSLATLGCWHAARQEAPPSRFTRLLLARDVAPDFEVCVELDLVDNAPVGNNVVCRSLDSLRREFAGDRRADTGSPMTMAGGR